MRKKIIICCVIVLVLAGSILFFYYGFVTNPLLSRDYEDEDVVVPLQDPEEKLIIKEWTYSVGSGAEIYYQRGEEKPVMIGQASSDLDTPFKDGAFEIIQNGRSIEIRFRFRASEPDRSQWRSITLELPDNS